MGNAGSQATGEFKTMEKPQDGTIGQAFGGGQGVAQGQLKDMNGGRGTLGQGQGFFKDMNGGRGTLGQGQGFFKDMTWRMPPNPPTPNPRPNPGIGRGWGYSYERKQQLWERNMPNLGGGSVGIPSGVLPPPTTNPITTVGTDIKPVGSTVAVNTNDLLNRGQFKGW